MQEIIRHEIGRDRLYKVWHRPTVNMIIYFHQGTGSIVSADGVYPIRPGVLCFVGSHQDHYTLPDLSYADDRSKVLFDDAMLSQISSCLGTLFTPNDIVFCELDEDIDQIFEWMEKYGKISGCMQLLSMLAQNSNNHTFIGRTSIERAIVHIQEHLAEPMDIDGICTAIHTSKYHFCRKFKEKTGLTVMNYILKTRIVMACNMIERTQHNMTRISEDCGFSSPAYFSRVFKDEMKMSPMQYKKQIKGAHR